jgi:hypothetical protein
LAALHLSAVRTESVAKLLPVSQNWHRAIRVKAALDRLIYRIHYTFAQDRFNRPNVSMKPDIEGGPIANIRKNQVKGCRHSSRRALIDKRNYYRTVTLKPKTTREIQGKRRPEQCSDRNQRANFLTHDETSTNAKDKNHTRGTALNTVFLPAVVRVILHALGNDPDSILSRAIPAE